jgi:hypothetical protein
MQRRLLQRCSSFPERDQRRKQNHCQQKRNCRYGNSPPRLWIPRNHAGNYDAHQQLVSAKVEALDILNLTTSLQLNEVAALLPDQSSGDISNVV